MKRRLAGGAAVMSAGVLPFVVNVPAAGADESAYSSREFDHSFVNYANQTVTCHISASASLYRPSGDPTFDAYASTSAYGPDPACDAGLGLDATYKNPNGVARRSQAYGANNHVSMYDDDVTTDYVVTHSVYFNNCAEGCFVSFQLKPK